MASFGSERRGTASAAFAVLVIILMGSLGQPRVSPAQPSHPAQALPLPLSPRGSGFHAAPLGLGSGPEQAAARRLSPPTYDEQIGATFTQNFSRIEYNVTALLQVDVNDYGPSYLIDGLTSKEYWYQVGISYHWPNSDGTFDPTWGMNYDVYGPNDVPAYPMSGGAGLANFSAPINSGDSVLLSLTFVGSQVEMSAYDWSTGATASANFSSFGATNFIGDLPFPSDVDGYFSGLMTEWYHVAPYSSNEQGVTFTNTAIGLNSAWMWLDEFKVGAVGTPSVLVFSSHIPKPVNFTNDQEVFPFFANGATMYVSAHQFTTGLAAGSSSSKVTLTPAVQIAPGPSFSASYTFAGQPQTTTMGAGANVVEADPGTLITISINTSASPPFQRWVFDGTAGTQVTVAAGSNATYLLYQVVQETVAYQVPAGQEPFPSSSAPVLHYEVPPALASSGSAPVSQSLVMGPNSTTIFALLGSTATINGTIQGTAGERWVASGDSWAITPSGLIPDPIDFFQQYQVSVGYTVSGGGTPPQTPDFTAASFGALTSLPLSSSSPTSGWFDAGTTYFFTSAVYNAAGTERWVNSGGNGRPPLVLTAPDESLSEVYSHQYFAQLEANDPNGGSISAASGWFAPGGSLAASAKANEGWQFEGWSGTGTEAYTGSAPSLNLVVSGPLTETATFDVELAVTAQFGTSVTYTTPSGSGTVQWGATKVVYVPPSNVTLSASSSLFAFNFHSWQGAAIADPEASSQVVSVSSPTAVRATASYDYAGLFVLVALAAAVAINLVAVGLWIRSRRRSREWAYI